MIINSCKNHLPSQGRRGTLAAKYDNELNITNEQQLECNQQNKTRDSRRENRKTNIKLYTKTLHTKLKD